jgi:replicative DNA helicase
MATPYLVREDDQRPASIHAETTILGGMLVDALAIVDATMLLRAADFSLDSHRRIYTAMLHLAEAGHAVDIVTVTEELRKRKELDSIGGVAYLASLSEGLPRKLSIESYVRIVKDKSLMRQLMTVGDIAINEAGDQSQHALDVLNKVGNLLNEISDDAITGGFSDIKAAKSPASPPTTSTSTA